MLKSIILGLVGGAFVYAICRRRLGKVVAIICGLATVAAWLAEGFVHGG